MILGVGIDIFEVPRMRRELAGSEWPDERGVFTTDEIGRCRSSRDTAECLAGCFAVKEAATKALGVRVGDLAMLGEVEVGPDARLTWSHRLKEASEQAGAHRARVSLASNRNQTGAIVIIES